MRLGGAWRWPNSSSRSLPRGVGRGACPLAPKAQSFSARAKSVIYLLWPERPATWSCSTTSRNWQSSTATLPPAELLKVIGPRSSTELEAAGSEIQVARYVRAAPSYRVLPHLATVVDDMPSSSRWSPTPSIMRPANPDEQRNQQFRGRASGLGHLRTGKRSHDLPAFVVFSTARRAQRGNSNWAAAFCRPCTRACISAAHANRALSVEPRGSTTLARRFARSDPRFNQHRWPSAIRRSPPARRLQMPGGCERRAGMMDCPMNQETLALYGANGKSSSQQLSAGPAAVDAGALRAVFHEAWTSTATWSKTSSRTA